MKQKFNRLLKITDEMLLETEKGEYIMIGCGDGSHACLAVAGEADGIISAITRVVEYLTTATDGAFSFDDIIEKVVSEHADRENQNALHQKIEEKGKMN